ncbi:MAG: tyrosine-type recombinase/integrase [Gammaproteobacteria bacterium]|nr:tyrosine-type recombinase/integrase [Gammaproteobacteria bacterium]
MKLYKSSELAAIKKRGLYRCADGLYLRVAKGGSKQFVQRIKYHGQRVDIGLGGWPATTLSEAKEAAIKNKAQVLAGGDPLAKRREAKRLAAEKSKPTFRQLNDTVLALERAGWKHPDVQAKKWISTMEAYALPVIGNRRIDDIDATDVWSVLGQLVEVTDPKTGEIQKVELWKAKHPTAMKLRVRMATIFRRAVALKYCTDNPAGEALDGILPKIRVTTEHRRALHWKELPGIMDAVGGTKYRCEAKAAFKFLVFTAARSAEVTGATWNEFDFESRTWTIPAERMKADQEHQIPLSDGAMAVLESVVSSRDGDALVFPGRIPGRSMGDKALLRVLRDAGGTDAHVHGCRATFKTWCGETGKARELAELSLAHKIGNAVEQAYDRTTLLERRRILMAAWSDHVTGTVGKVVALPAKTA